MSETAPVDAASEPPLATTPGTGAPRKHLWEVDIVRILTFLCVISVHTISHTVAASDLPLYLLLGLVHFTRDVFFALTAFVLVYSYFHKPVPMRRFWPRRFLLVGVPYLAWSVIYFVSNEVYHQTHASVGTLALELLRDIATGTAWYHLYFLLVTMQVYLLVPVILWLVRKTRGRHVPLLVIAGAVQLALVAGYFYFPDSVGLLLTYSKQYFFSYIFFIIGGAVAADHQVEFLGWIRAHRGAIAVMVAATAIVTLGVFLLQMAAGKSPTAAVTPLQPIVMVWGVAVALGLLAIGTYWADRRKPTGLGTRFVATASDRSFGIFLSHPLFIWILLWIGNDWVADAIPKPWLTLVVYIAVIICAIGLTELLRRTPLSLPLTGRPFHERSKNQVQRSQEGSAR